MKTFLASMLLLLLPASRALAAGVDIAWDNCLGEPGAVSLKQFACDTNTGREDLWISFASPVSAASMGLLEVAVDFRTKTGIPLPVWWDFEDLASCRRAALSVNTEPPYESPLCARAFTTASQPTFVVDGIDYQLPTVDAGRLVVAANLSGPLVAEQRYLACRLVLSHAKTSTCAGCTEPVNITVTAVRIDGSVILSNPITNNVALWQQNLPTAARKTTWTALKGLYH